MPAIERGNFESPKKSPLNYEVYGSGFERQMMEKLDNDPTVRKWTKRHGISIFWVDSRHRRHRYRPDFLVEYTDGSLCLKEVKAANRVDSDEVQRKRRAAAEWCRQRGMEYEIDTIPR